MSEADDPILSPVLLLAFKRPEETRATIRALGVHRPQHVFVWIDAPRNDAEKPAVDSVARVVYEEIDWVTPTVFRNTTNRGMTRAFGAALNWFFDQVEEGIVIEDDCVVGRDFLRYSQELLERYRDSPNVLAVMGDNAAGGKISGKASYAFVPDFSVWGWATWKRVWDLYDYELSDWPQWKSNNRRLREYWPNRIQRKKWVRRFDQLYSDDGTLQESNWRFLFIGLKTKGYFILPRYNLITNIGVDESTATSGSRGWVRTMEQTHPILPLRHPRRVRYSPFANWTLFFSPRRNNRQETWWYPIRKSARKKVRSSLRALKAILRQRRATRAVPLSSSK